MRILLNAASAHMGGAVTHLQNILDRLPEELPRAHIIVYVPEGTTAALPKRAGVEVRPYPYASTQGLRRLYFDQVAVPRRAARERVDVLFSATGFGTLWSPVPQVLLVRNMKYFDPQFQAKCEELGRSFRGTRLRRWHSLLSIWAADTVLFPTRAMQATVASHVSLDGTATHPLHYGFDADTFGAEPAPSAPNPCIKEESEGPTLLNVSTYAIHKNLETLVEALPRLRDQHPGLTLVTTTSRTQTSDTAEYDALTARARKLGVADAWTELGYVPHDELPPLYRTADAYVFPSFTESFGHSMVEAMASGLPVVAADTPVNREVCADAGVYFSPFDASGCADAVHAVLSDKQRADELRRKSAQRAERFSWRRYARRLAEIFRAAART
jgi:glycosyltransferase involved in cell wall biosynthesis